MILEKTKIYGVEGVCRSTRLDRTDDSVGLSYTIGESEIVSDFNHCYPWSEMQEVSDDYGNVFIRIPKFYTKVTKKGDGSYKYQISGCRYEGFTTLFVDGKGNEIDYVLVGKYEASGSSEKAFSKSGQTVLVNVGLESMRNACKAHGDGYQQYDLLIDAIIKQLFTIEFATTNSQGIMMGWVSGSAALVTGHTDSIKTASGSWNENHKNNCVVCNSDGLHACKYRGIENPWGNVECWCDGINFENEKVYVCLDPTKYATECVTMPYSYMGNRPMGNTCLMEVTPFEKFPAMGYCTKLGGAVFAGFCDGYNSYGTVLCVGGSYIYNEESGIWFYDGGFDSTWWEDPAVGGRLCYKPL